MIHYKYYQQTKKNEAIWLYIMSSSGWQLQLNDGGGGKGGMNWERSTETYTPACVKLLNM